MGEHSGHDHKPRRLPIFVRAHPHSHGRSEQVANALSSSAEGLRALWISLAGLALTAAVQGAVVAASSSVGLLADTLHNLADALTAVPLAVAFYIGRRPPDKTHTYGYGRAEDLAGLAVVAAIAGSSVVTAWQAVARISHPHRVHALALVVVAGMVGFAGNELVAVYRIRTGRRIGSVALVADGQHARSDGLASLAVVAGAGGVALGWRLADPVAALIITIAILGVLVEAGRDVKRRLMDSVDPALVDEVTSVLDSVEGVEEVEAVRIRWIGHELHAEAEIVSDADLTIAQAHQISEEARHRLLHEVPRLAQAVIHTSPCAHTGTDPHSATAHHFQREA